MMILTKLSKSLYFHNDKSHTFSNHRTLKCALVYMILWFNDNNDDDSDDNVKTPLLP